MSEVVPALGTPPMMKCGKQTYLWSTKTGTHRGSKDCPEAGACSARNIELMSSTPWKETASLKCWNMLATWLGVGVGVGVELGC